MANSYSTIGSVKALMPDNVWSTKYDALLTELLLRASRLVDSILRRKPGAFAVANNETYYFNGSGGRVLMIGELAATPALVAVSLNGVVDNNSGAGGNYVQLSESDYFCTPYNRLEEGKPFLSLEINRLSSAVQVWPRLTKSVKVTGRFGFSTSQNTPDEIKQAVEIQTVRWWKRGQQAFQDAGAISELGQLRYVKNLDPDIVQILKVERFSWL